MRWSIKSISENATLWTARENGPDTTEYEYKATGGDYESVAAEKITSALIADLDAGILPLDQCLCSPEVSDGPVLLNSATGYYPAIWLWRSAKEMPFTDRYVYLGFDGYADHSGLHHNQKVMRRIAEYLKR